MILTIVLSPLADQLALFGLPNFLASLLALRAAGRYHRRWR